jgi:sec-independent protein translocase protein TatA
MVWPGPTELLIILGIVVVLFGASKLPQIGSGLGKAIKNFKGSIKETPLGEDGSNQEKIEDKPKES